VCGDECTQHKNYKLVECNISVTITVTPKFINFVQLEVFINIISHQFTNCGNMYTSFMVVVITAAVALVITVGRHVWHYAKSICLTWCCLTSVHFLLISHGYVNSTACVLNSQSLGIQLIRLVSLINPPTFINTHKPKLSLSLTHMVWTTPRKITPTL